METGLYRKLLAGENTLSIILRDVIQATQHTHISTATISHHSSSDEHRKKHAYTGRVLTTHIHTKKQPQNDTKAHTAKQETEYSC